jgi:hypothetical protein
MAAGIESCRKIADRCVFIMGNARSSTTICSRLVNAHPQAFVLTEAEFFLDANEPAFRDRYNAKHAMFGNQVSKSSYAPNLAPTGEGRWWEWLASAASFYSIVGDKLAFGAHVFGQASPYEILSFFEARFFASRYVFLFRRPIETLRSIAKLSGDASARRMVADMDGWLQYVQFWADAVRILPNTLTIMTNVFGEAETDELGAFLDISLTHAYPLLNPNLRQTHAVDAGDLFEPSVARRLTDIYTAVEQAVAMPHVMRQAEQKRRQSARDMSEHSRSLVQPLPLGEAWAMAEALRADLAAGLQPTLFPY